ncbi:MAG: hypothetical protein LBB05_02800 [Puniceicoccales bacterium]|jgi:type III secretion protein C|nr:hypothetical protein [Puniceicoccales bacterium]
MRGFFYTVLGISTFSLFYAALDNNSKGANTVTVKNQKVTSQKVATSTVSKKTGKKTGNVNSSAGVHSQVLAGISKNNKNIITIDGSKSSRKKTNLPKNTQSPPVANAKPSPSSATTIPLATVAASGATSVSVASVPTTTNTIASAPVATTPPVPVMATSVPVANVSTPVTGVPSSDASASVPAEQPSITARRPPPLHATEPTLPDNSLENEHHNGSSEWTVIGDSKTPLIDRSSIEMVNSMVFTKGDPVDHLPLKTSGYYHFAKDQDLKELIRNFFSMQSMDVIVSDNIGDMVNGKFSDVTPRQFWKDIVNAYGLVWFFDGSMMYAYKSNEVTSTVYQMSRDEMRTLVKVITQLGWLSSNVTFRPLETAGILVVSGPPKLMSLLQELSKKVVVERVSNVYDIRSFPLKHAWSFDMSVNYRGGNMTIPGVATMLQQIVSALPVPVGDSNIGVTINNSKSNEATETRAIPGTVYHTNESKKNNSDPKEDSKNNHKNDEKNPLNLSEIFVTHDARLNAVIVKAKHQDMAFIENIIQQLDVPRDAIKIDVAVVDITKGGAMKIGSKFAVQRRNTGAAAGGAAAGNTDRIAFDFLEKASASITMNFDKLFRNYSLSETLNILEDVGNAQTLTRSSVITLDNIGAVIDRSSTVYTPVAGAKAGGLYDVTVSTKLVVVPHIIPGEFDCNGSPKIKLLIEVTDGSFDKDARINANSPATATNSVNTEASLFAGQSLFIGGYFHENHSVASAGVPFLKDIPLLGYLFKVNNRDDSVAERIYIITPSIIDMNEPKRTQLNRFFTDSQLSGEPTLKPDEFILTHDYERPSFDNATFDPKAKQLTWNKLFKSSEEDRNREDKNVLEVKKSVQRRSRMKTSQRR